MEKLTIDMSYLIFAWQDDSPDNLYYLDVTTGDITLVNRNLLDLRELTDEIEQDRERYLYLPKPAPDELKQDLIDFMRTVQDAKIKATLEMAFESPHLLSAFKKIVSSDADELKRLEEFRTDKTRARIEKWLKANFIAY